MLVGVGTGVTCASIGFVVSPVAMVMLFMIASNPSPVADIGRFVPIPVRNTVQVVYPLMKLRGLVGYIPAGPE